MNIKTKIENIGNDKIQIIRLNIFKNNDKIKPYFFIRNQLSTKNYRISISFIHLNKNFGLDIGIIRDFKKLELTPKELKTFLTDFNFIQKITSPDNDSFFISISKYKSLDNSSRTNIFLISKFYENEYSQTLVYFSKDFPNINIFLKEKNYE